MANVGKYALVTGAAKRFGREIAIHLARLGWNVAIHYHTSEEDALRTAADVRALGVKAAIVKADLANETAVGDLVPRVTREFGPLTALINNASNFEHDDWSTVTRESWDLHMEANLRAPFVLSQRFAQLIEKGADGSIINITDQRVLKPTPRFMSYSLSRAGLHWLTTTMAQALAPNIRVNEIAPGPSFIGKRQSPEMFERQRSATILGRGATSTDLLGAISYLLASRSVTGQTIAVDGGQHIAWQTPDVMVQE